MEDITIVPSIKASIILILVPDPNLRGTHIHLALYISLYKFFFDTIPLLTTKEIFYIHHRLK